MALDSGQLVVGLAGAQTASLNHARPVVIRPTPAVGSAAVPVAVALGQTDLFCLVGQPTHYSVQDDIWPRECMRLRDLDNQMVTDMINCIVQPSSSIQKAHGVLYTSVLRLKGLFLSVACSAWLV